MGWDGWIRTVEIEPAIDALDAGTHEHSVETLVRTGCKLIHLNGGAHEGRHVRDAASRWVQRRCHARNVRSLYLAGARVLVADQPIFEREDLPRAYRRLVQALT